MSNPLNLNMIVPPQLRGSNHFHVGQRVLHISLFTNCIETDSVKLIDANGHIRLEGYTGQHFRIKDPCIITEIEYRTILKVDYFPHGLSYKKIRVQASQGDAPSISVFYYLGELKNRGGENWSVTKFLKEAQKH